MKRAALTQEQRIAVEQLLMQYGSIVTFEQIAQVTSHLSGASLRRFVSTLVRLEWLVRIKKGLYQIAEIGALGSLTLSRYTIANLLHETSYVSFETALQYHGLFDQLLASTTSVALSQHKSVLLQGICYSYITTTQKYFYGYGEYALDSKLVKIATVEKALIDLIQFRRNATTVDLTAETLHIYGQENELRQLKTYLQSSPVAVQRVFGFLLDTLGFETGDLCSRIKGKTDVTKLTAESHLYNAKWRLYYDPYFIKEHQTP